MPGNNAVHMTGSILFVSADFVGDNGDSRGIVTVDLSEWRTKQLDKLKEICSITLKRIGGMSPEELGPWLRLACKESKRTRTGNPYAIILWQATRS